MSYLLGDGGTYEVILPNGMKCTLVPGSRLVQVGVDGEVLSVIVDNTIPSGLCPQCGKPWDDHRQGECPKVTA